MQLRSLCVHKTKCSLRAACRSMPSGKFFWHTMHSIDILGQCPSILGPYVGPLHGLARWLGTCALAPSQQQHAHCVVATQCRHVYYLIVRTHTTERLLPSEYSMYTTWPEGREQCTLQQHKECVCKRTTNATCNALARLPQYLYLRAVGLCGSDGCVVTVTTPVTQPHCCNL